eukprot:366404-Chlamydomonas_euryale.AAC.11
MPTLSSTQKANEQSRQDVLRRLPGVTDANFRPLMDAAGSLAGLADMDLPRLEAAMGGRGAKMLREFLDAPVIRPP